MSQETYELEPQLEGLKVLLCIPSLDGNMPILQHVAISRLFKEAREYGLIMGDLYELHNSLIPQARNNLVHQFLTKTDYDKCFFIDSDIIFEPEQAMRLIAWSTFYNVVSGVYPTKSVNPTYYVQATNTKPNEHGLLKVKSLGLGFTIIDRKVFEKLDVPSYHNPGEPEAKKAYFQSPVTDGYLIGEDVWFFRLLQTAGIDAHVDPIIDLGHRGTMVYRASFIKSTKEVNKEDMENAVIIP